MSDEYVYNCDSCDRPVSAEQWGLMACCIDCSRQLRSSWSKLDSAEGGQS